jgi:transcription elongation factor GreA
MVSIMKRNCLEIKDLEQRLICLKEKYQQLLKQLEIEREGMISDEIGNYQEVLIEREFVYKQIEVLEKRLKVKERIARKREASDKVKIGSRVKLQNHTHALDVYLVEENEARPKEHLISILSPIGRAIFGRRRGENITVELPRGVIDYTIAEIL